MPADLVAKRPLRISFGTPKTMAWDADNGEFTGAARRHAQVYVFALLAHVDKMMADPLNLDQWTFSVFHTAVLNKQVRSRRVPGRLPCAERRLVPHVPQQRAGRRTGPRHGATEP